MQVDDEVNDIDNDVIENDDVDNEHEPNPDENDSESEEVEKDEESEESGEEEESSPDEGESGSDDKSQKKELSNKKFKRKIYHASQEIKRLNAELEAIKAAKQKPEEPELAEPNREDFETFNDYLQANREFVAEKTRREVRAEVEKERAQKQQEAEQRRLLSNWETQKEAAQDKYDDFDDTLETSDLIITRKMSEIIFESPVAGELAYYLAKNPEEAEGFDKMSEVQLTRAMLKIESKLEAEVKERPKGTKKPVSKAPQPTSKVKASKTSDTSKASPKDKDEDYIRKRREERRKRR